MNLTNALWFWTTVKWENNERKQILSEAETDRKKKNTKSHGRIDTWAGWGFRKGKWGSWFYMNSRYWLAIRQQQAGGLCLLQDKALLGTCKIRILDVWRVSSDKAHWNSSFLSPAVPFQVISTGFQATSAQQGNHWVLGRWRGCSPNK